MSVCRACFKHSAFQVAPTKINHKAIDRGNGLAKKCSHRGRQRCSNLVLKASVDGRTVYPSCWHQMVARSMSRLCRPPLKYDGIRAETRFRSAKRTSPFKSAGASVQSTTGSRGVRISGSNAQYTIFRGSVKSTGYQLHSPVSLHFPSRASPCAITFQLDSNSGNKNSFTIRTCRSDVTATALPVSSSFILEKIRTNDTER